jgi:hypothetical protein
MSMVGASFEVVDPGTRRTELAASCSWRRVSGAIGVKSIIDNKDYAFILRMLKVAMRAVRIFFTLIIGAGTTGATSLAVIRWNQ